MFNFIASQYWPHLNLFHQCIRSSILEVLYSSLGLYLFLDYLSPPIIWHLWTRSLLDSPHSLLPIYLYLYLYRYSSSPNRKERRSGRPHTLTLYLSVMNLSLVSFDIEVLFGTEKLLVFTSLKDLFFCSYIPKTVTNSNTDWDIRSPVSPLNPDPLSYTNPVNSHITW